MSCRWCREALSAILDDEAVGGDAVVVDAHLARCPECRAVADAMVAVTRMARDHDTGPFADPAFADVLPDLLSASGIRPVAGARPGGPPTPVCGGGRRLDIVGDAACGCVRGCGCGCQNGGPCRCSATAA